MRERDVSSLEFLRVNDVAKKYGVVRSTVMSWIKRGDLEATKVGRLILVKKNDADNVLDIVKRKNQSR